MDDDVIKKQMVYFANQLEAEREGRDRMKISLTIKYCHRFKLKPGFIVNQTIKLSRTELDKIRDYVTFSLLNSI